jgi:MFS family permease
MIFLSAGILSGAFGSVAAGAITSRMDGSYGIAGWRWLFLIEGVATVGISLGVHWVLLDHPATSKQLTPLQRRIATHRLQQDGITSHQSKGGHIATLRYAFVKVILDWRVWLLVPAYMTVLGNFAISYFFPLLVKGLGYTATNAQ